MDNKASSYQDKVKAELDQLYEKGKTGQKRVMKKIFFAVVTVWVSILILYFYSAYEEVIVDQKELEDSVAKITRQVEVIEKEVSIINENMTLVEFTQTSTVIQSKCKEIIYDIPTKQFKYDVGMSYESLEILETCNAMVYKMNSSLDLLLEQGKSNVDPVAEEIPSWTSDVEDLKRYLEDLRGSRINPWTEVFGDFRSSFLVVGIGVILVWISNSRPRKASK